MKIFEAYKALNSLNWNWCVIRDFVRQDQVKYVM